VEEGLRIVEGEVTGGCWKFFVFSVLTQIKEDLGRKVSILVRDSIGHYEKCSYENVSILNSYRNGTV
jgi:hypothetical protein